MWLVGSYRTGKITVQVNWFNLWSKPATVTLHDVYALAVPIAERPYDRERHLRLQTARKQNLLAELENSSLVNDGKSVLQVL